MALQRTLDRRPDLLEGQQLGREDLDLINKLKEAGT